MEEYIGCDDERTGRGRRQPLGAALVSQLGGTRAQACAAFGTMNYLLFPTAVSSSASMTFRLSAG